MLRFRLCYIAALPLVVAAMPAFAYVGPGAGITMIGALIGVVVAVLAALGAILFWPIRAWIKGRRAKAAAAAAGPARRADGTPPAAE